MRPGDFDLHQLSTGNLMSFAPQLLFEQVRIPRLGEVRILDGHCNAKHRFAHAGSTTSGEKSSHCRRLNFRAYETAPAVWWTGTMWVRKSGSRLSDRWGIHPRRTS